MQYTNFTTTITSQFTDNIINIRSKISLGEKFFKENSIIDLTIGFDYGACSSIIADYKLYNVADSVVGSGVANIEDKKLILSEIVADDDIYYIGLNIAIISPSWTEHIIEDTPTIKTFYFDGNQYNCYEGMTWAEFCDSDFNTYNNFYYKTSSVYYVTSSKQVQYMYENVYDYNVNLTYYPYVNPTDVINTFAHAGGSNDPGMEQPSAGDEPSATSYDVALTSTVEYTYNFTITSVGIETTDADENYSGIIGWIKKVVNGITNLPTLIINGIKGLFVPTQDRFVEIRNNFEDLLELRFGAVYDSAQIIDDFANAFKSNSETALVPDAGDGFGNQGVSFPSVTVNLAGTDFSFGGWNVDLKYPGFEALYDALAMITNILATFYVVNAFRNRFEGVLK